MANEKEYISVNEASERIGCSRATVINYIKRGKLEGKKHLNKWFVPLDQVKKFEFNFS